ncbi:MAG TPA: GAF and ANTAR domain-containing protein [Mycobacteriales bacterium]|nr:GAF and ANTAR domain-containing protein [Mycobacteriales bacterium]
MTEADLGRPGGVGTAGGWERSLTETFVTLADTLVADYDVVDLLDRLVMASVDLLGVTASGLLLDDQTGHLALVASSSEESRLLELFQLQHDQGPCVDCVHDGAPVSVDDLAAHRDRWPLFVPAALELGFRSMTAVPLRLREHVVGGLGMFHEGPVTMSPDNQRLAQALADVATIGILQRRSVHRSTVVAGQLQHALTSRIAIEQAKGVLAERLSIGVDQALDVMRRYARSHNEKLTEVALAVVNGAVDLSSDGTLREQ